MSGLGVADGQGEGGDEREGQVDSHAAYSASSAPVVPAGERDVGHGDQADGLAVHVGRAWSGHRAEDGCPCPQEPCGLVDTRRIDPECPQHAWGRAKTIRQSHLPRECPGADCEHLSESGADGPVGPQGEPTRWRCDHCGAVR